jgi:hypothetical protein
MYNGAAERNKKLKRERQQLTKERDKAYKESRGMLSLLEGLELRHNEAVTSLDCVWSASVSRLRYADLYMEQVSISCSLIHKFVNDVI